MRAVSSCGAGTLECMGACDCTERSLDLVPLPVINSCLLCMQVESRLQRGCCLHRQCHMLLGHAYCIVPPHGLPESSYE